jgi:hypothetical protein
VNTIYVVICCKKDQIILVPHELLCIPT